jgi:hypothetical protein
LKKDVSLAVLKSTGFFGDSSQSEFAAPSPLGQACRPSITISARLNI